MTTVEVLLGPSRISSESLKSLSFTERPTQNPNCTYGIALIAKSSSRKGVKITAYATLAMQENRRIRQYFYGEKNLSWVWES